MPGAVAFRQPHRSRPGKLPACSSYSNARPDANIRVLLFPGVDDGGGSICLTTLGEVHTCMSRE